MADELVDNLKKAAEGIEAARKQAEDPAPPQLPRKSPSLFRRLVALVRRAANRPSGAFLVATLLAALMLHGVRVIAFAVVDYAEHLTLEVSQSMQRQNEPRGDDEYFGVVASLLGRIGEDDPTEDCRNEHPSRLGEPDAAVCRNLHVVQAAFGELWRGATGATTAHDAAAKAAEKLKGLGDGKLAADDKWLASTEALVAAVRAQLSPKPGPRLPTDTDVLVPCPRRQMHYLTHDGDFGDMGCEQPSPEPATLLTVPSLENLCPEAWGTFCASERAARAVIGSRLLDPIIKVVAATPESGGDDHLSLVQAYFISTDDVLRIWNRGLVPGNNPEDLFPLTRRWTGAHYFNQFLGQSRADNLSFPYIDYGGYGLVRTWCFDVAEPVDKHDSRLFGVICQDFTLPLARLDEGLQKSDMFDVKMVKVWATGGEVLFSPDQLRFEDTLKQLKDSDKRVALDTEKELAGRLRAVAFTRNLRMRELARHVTPVQKPGESSLSFLVPLGGSRDQTMFRGALLTPKVHGVSITTRVWVFTSLLAILLILIVADSVRRSRREAHASVQNTLVRSLQVGVLVVTDRDYIEGVNDRAEELLGVPLPKIGVDCEDNMMRRFDDCILPDILEDDGAGSYRIARYASRIPALRIGGEASSYYAKLSGDPARSERAGEWVRITASPRSYIDWAGITAVLRRYPSPPTFGVVEPIIDPRFWHRLEVAYQLTVSQSAVLIADTKGNLKAANDAAERVLGLNLPRSANGTLLSRLTPKNVFEPLVLGAPDATSGNPCHPCESVLNPSLPARAFHARILQGLRKGAWVKLTVTRMPASQLDDSGLVRALIRVDDAGDELSPRLTQIARLEEPPAGMMILDPRGNVEAANGTAQSLLGEKLPRPAVDAAPLAVGLPLDRCLEGRVVLAATRAAADLAGALGASFYAKTRTGGNWVAIEAKGDRYYSVAPIDVNAAPGLEAARSGS